MVTVLVARDVGLDVRKTKKLYLWYILKLEDISSNICEGLCLTVHITRTGALYVCECKNGSDESGGEDMMLMAVLVLSFTNSGILQWRAFSSVFESFFRDFCKQ